MVTLINKRAAITVSKSNKSILKNMNVNKNKEKRKRNNGSEQNETSVSSSTTSLSSNPENLLNQQVKDQDTP